MIIVALSAWQSVIFVNDVSLIQQQEQDTTNLYFANLPSYLSEADLKLMIVPFGQVISTRILRDNQGISRGVGFARMESKEKCEDIIREFSGKFLPGKYHCVLCLLSLFTVVLVVGKVTLSYFIQVEKRGTDTSKLCH